MSPKCCPPFLVLLALTTVPGPITDHITTSVNSLLVTVHNVAHAAQSHDRANERDRLNTAARRSSSPSPARLPRLPINPPRLSPLSALPPSEALPPTTADITDVRPSKSQHTTNPTLHSRLSRLPPPSLVFLAVSGRRSFLLAPLSRKHCTSVQRPPHSAAQLRLRPTSAPCLNDAHRNRVSHTTHGS
ncbi:hypothetical protein B0H13DRAFT_2524949 [Mycena leptocephala]|nr:hypothetical protein B0H13DRAFT_2524949 [Mycena leptocephala]